MMASVCCGCGGRFPAVAGETHPYMLSSPGCWSAYGAVLAREYQDPALFAACHRLTVDAYALQHPGDPADVRAMRSVWLHFASLHAIFARGFTLDQATALLRRIAPRSFGRLPPPPPDWGMTLGDLPADAGAHACSVRNWARVAYDGWYPMLAQHADLLVD